MSMVWKLRAGCKVNLYLDIVGVREDGYHEIESLFYPLPAPCDILDVGLTRGQGLLLTCSAAALETEENILSRVYSGFAGATGFAPGVSVHLDKNIPMGAGLGGGSSDAAVFLSWLNARAGERALPKSELSRLALTLGADVPFFLGNEPAWVTGIGEKITPVSCDLTSYTVLVVCPEVHVDTKWAYKRWDEMFESARGRPRKELTPENSPIMSLCFTKPPKLWNGFEEVVFHEFPTLYEVKKHILNHFPDACVMSGSGSSFVALFSSPERAVRCAGDMRAEGHACYASSFGEPLVMDS
ncbi:4-(cytidine 5'-diphospho)-2-C-methyl-D-erythritol kinase [Desulfomicrobium sp. ZS1]|uniref:4-(cytidine 5'-diphospho)-2-C-methyl-D-erythritol kinase n=1 Tax=Desulfomicrobium sp. ZS1 TaxID=2952228 RepID=UPI0020B37DCA|nr:4-(cytidine 5'-diphospho)-2-C-methyl-D-erythritol kinase [Desulfomicrobium sp. ZS1]UTF50984.1 4-(cytidine 5'-diphospho)-2-C-methyl-D-erythritol kinase [Desulfomicrobium sp. ZS1]